MTILRSDTAQIRKKLEAAFDASGLSAFCLDYFEEVYDKFSPGMRKDDKITLLLDYCRRHPTGFERLLNGVRQEYAYAKRAESGEMSHSPREELSPLIDALEAYTGSSLPIFKGSTSDAVESRSSKAHDPLLTHTKLKTRSLLRLSLLFDFVLIIAPVLIIGTTLWLEIPSITMTSVLLVGVWVSDAYLKHAFGLGRHTIFADLSFTAFILMASKELSLVIDLINGINKSEYLVELGAITCILWLFWLGNLSICRHFVTQPSMPPQNHISPYWVWGVSCFLSIISTTLVLFPLYIGMI